MRSAFVIFSFLISNLLWAADGNSPNLKAVQEYLAESFANSHYPGISYTLVNREGILLEGGFGVEVAGTDRPMTEHSSSAIGSITKSFTSFAIMRLVEEGKIDLDEKVVTYLPWFQTARKPNSDKITVRQLLGNSSGLPSLDLGILGQDNSAAAPERMVRAMSSYVMDREPGVRFEYSNEGFAVAGLVASTVSGLPYPELIATYVLEPLGMTRSTSDPERFEQLNALLGHYAGWKQGIPVEKSMLGMGYAAAGSHLHCSSHDMGAYMMALLNKGKLGSKQILSPKSITTMWTPHIKLPEDMDGDRGAYGLGWALETIDNRPIVHHGGNALTMTSFTMLDPTRGIGITLLSNSASLYPQNNFNLRTLANNALHILNGENTSDWGRPKYDDRTLNDYELPMDLHANYLGTYKTGGLSNQRIRVFTRKGRLHMEAFMAQQKTADARLDFINPTQAALRGIGSVAILRFKIRPDGTVNGGSYSGESFHRVKTEDMPSAVSLLNGKISFQLPGDWQVREQAQSFQLEADGVVLSGGFIGSQRDAFNQAISEGETVSQEMAEFGESLAGRFWLSKAYHVTSQHGNRQKRIFVTHSGAQHFYLLADAREGQLTRLLQKSGFDLLSSLQLN